MKGVEPQTATYNLCNNFGHQWSLIWLGTPICNLCGGPWIPSSTDTKEDTSNE